MGLHKKYRTTKKVRKEMCGLCKSIHKNDVMEVNSEYVYNYRKMRYELERGVCLCYDCSDYYKDQEWVWNGVKKLKLVDA